MALHPNEEIVPCPVCDRGFPKFQLQQHVNTCLDSGGVTPDAAPRAPPPTSSSGGSAPPPPLHQDPHYNSVANTSGAPQGTYAAAAPPGTAGAAGGGGYSYGGYQAPPATTSSSTYQQQQWGAPAPSGGTAAPPAGTYQQAQWGTPSATTSTTAAVPPGNVNPTSKPPIGDPDPDHKSWPYLPQWASQRLNVYTHQQPQWGDSILDVASRDVLPPDQLCMDCNKHIKSCKCSACYYCKTSVRMGSRHHCRKCWRTTCGACREKNRYLNPSSPVNTNVLVCNGCSMYHALPRIVPQEANIDHLGLYLLKQAMDHPLVCVGADCGLQTYEKECSKCNLPTVPVTTHWDRCVRLHDGNRSKQGKQFAKEMMKAEETRRQQTREKLFSTLTLQDEEEMFNDFTGDLDDPDLALRTQLWTDYQHRVREAKAAVKLYEEKQLELARTGSSTSLNNNNNANGGGGGPSSSSAAGSLNSSTLLNQSGTTTTAHNLMNENTMNQEPGSPTMALPVNPETIPKPSLPPPPFMGADKKLTRTILLSAICSTVCYEYDYSPHTTLSMNDFPYSKMLKLNETQQLFSIFEGRVCGKKTIFVAIPGTHDMRTTITDIKFTRVHEIEKSRIHNGQPPYSTTGHHGGVNKAWEYKVHNGFHQEEVKLRNVLPTSRCKEFLDQGYDVIITGHSLGGALASLTTLRHLNEDPGTFKGKLMCVTFGAPLVGNSLLTRKIERCGYASIFHHVVFKSDIVPRLLTGREFPKEDIIRAKNRLTSWFTSPWGGSSSKKQEEGGANSSSGNKQQQKDDDGTMATGANQNMEGLEIDPSVIQNAYADERSLTDDGRTNSSSLSTTRLQQQGYYFAEEERVVGSGKTADLYRCQYGDKRPFDCYGRYHFLHRDVPYKSTDVPAEAFAILKYGDGLSVSVGDHMLGSYYKSLTYHMGQEKKYRRDAARSMI